jgi:hypothetical protein
MAVTQHSTAQHTFHAWKSVPVVAPVKQGAAAPAARLGYAVLAAPASDALLNHSVTEQDSQHMHTDQSWCAAVATSSTTGCRPQVSASDPRLPT